MFNFPYLAQFSPRSQLASWKAAPWTTGVCVFMNKLELPDQFCVSNNTMNVGLYILQMLTTISLRNQPFRRLEPSTNGRVKTRRKTLRYLISTHMFSEFGGNSRWNPTEMLYTDLTGTTFRPQSRQRLLKLTTTLLLTSTAVHMCN